MQRRRDGVPFLCFYLLAFKFKGHFIARRDGEDRVTLNLVHVEKILVFIQLLFYCFAYFTQRTA